MLHLKIISGSAKGAVYPLEESNLPITIGRGPENTITLDHTAVSREHCRISSLDLGYYIEDLGSTNGTYLNARQITRERLCPGDEIIVASVGMVIEATSVSIHGRSAPIGVNVSIDYGPGANKEPMVLDDAATVGTKEFIEGFARMDPKRAYRALELMAKADSALRDLDDLRQLLVNLLELIMESVPANRGYIFLIQKDTGNLMPYVRFPIQEIAEDEEIVVSQTILRTAVKQQASIICNDALVDERFIHSRSIAEFSVQSAMCAPLINRNKTLGIIYVDSSDRSTNFSHDDLALFSAIALKAGIAIDNARLYDDMRGLFYNTVETLVRTIQAKDQYTSGHSTRVSRYALLMGERLGLDADEKHKLYLASMLHDIGKIGVPDDLLKRPGKLNAEEMDKVRSHVLLGASMIEMLGELHPIVPLIRHHHECFDGSGYPDGLKGEDIPLISRIVAVADMYDAMTSDRAYRRRLSRQDAIDEIKRTSGTKIDPRVANAFLEILEELIPHVDSEPASPPTGQPVI